MKTPKPKKLILDQAFLEEEFFENSLLLGIVCPLSYYRFIWNLHTLLNFDFRRNHEFEIKLTDMYFPVYQMTEKDKIMEHFIFVNRKKSTFLLPELRNIDFIWMIKGNNDIISYQHDIVNKLKNMTMIDSCFQIPITQLKSKHILIV